MIRHCTLSCCRTDGGKSLEIVISNCTIVNVSTFGKNNEDKLTETLAIRFGSVDIFFSMTQAENKWLLELVGMAAETSRYRRAIT
jgi:type VI protein secretion system component Hcp